MLFVKEVNRLMTVIFVHTVGEKGLGRGAKHPVALFIVTERKNIYLSLFLVNIHQRSLAACEFNVCLLLLVYR
jgi:hypothetical protein